MVVICYDTSLQHATLIPMLVDGGKISTLQQLDVVLGVDALVIGLFWTWDTSVLASGIEKTCDLVRHIKSGLSWITP